MYTYSGELKLNVSVGRTRVE